MFGEAVGVKISHKVSSHLIKFGKNRQFLKILVLIYREKRLAVKDGEKKRRSLLLISSLP